MVAATCIAFALVLPRYGGRGGQKFWHEPLLSKSIDDSRTDTEEEQVAGVGEMMHNSFGAAACIVQGAGDDQKEAMQKDFGVFVDLLAEHFKHHKFLLGDRACIADFALVGPFKGHFFTGSRAKGLAR